MSNYPRDLDPNERDAINGLEDQFEAMRRRHASDPAFDLLRAAHEGVLPDNVQADVLKHLTGSPASQALVADLGDDEPELPAVDRERLLTRILRHTSETAERPRRVSWHRPFLLFASVAAAILVTWLVTHRTATVPARPAETEIAAEPPKAAPPFLLAFDKPEVRLGLGVLKWRGPGQSDDLMAHLKPALDAYRRDDYATADRELTRLAGRYPGMTEIAFYQGVSRLFLDDPSGAAASLAAAEAIGDPAFAADVSWYRAVADQRRGNVTDALSRLDALCQANGDRAERACAARDELRKATSTQR